MLTWDAGITQTGLIYCSRNLAAPHLFLALVQMIQQVDTQKTDTHKNNSNFPQEETWTYFCENYLILYGDTTGVCFFKINGWEFHTTFVIIYVPLLLLVISFLNSKADFNSSYSLNADYHKK